MGTKILFFGGFGPLEETDPAQEGAEFGWYNDLFSFDTGMYSCVMLIFSIKISVRHGTCGAKLLTFFSF